MIPIKLPSLPKWAWALIAAGVLALGFAAWLALHDRKVIATHETGITATVDRKDAAGDAAGNAKAEGVRERVAGENARASGAAVGSDDPLKDGLDELGK
jgi:hypothetical protein